jgi:flagellar basal-body rod protein FlgB
MGATDITIEAVRLALNAASLRHAAIAGNVANAGSTNYVPMRVTFEDRLADALAASRWGGDNEVARAISDLQPELVSSDGPKQVQIETEMTQLSVNSLRYHALAKGLSRYFSMASVIATGGKG